MAAVEPARRAGRGRHAERRARRAVERRNLVKTWTLRGTLHLHNARDLPLWLALRRQLAGVSRRAVVRARAARPCACRSRARGDRRGAARARAPARGPHRRRLRARRRVGARGALFRLGALLSTPRCTRACSARPPAGAKVTLARTDEWASELRPFEGDARRGGAAVLSRPTGRLPTARSAQMARGQAVARADAFEAVDAGGRRPTRRRVGDRLRRRVGGGADRPLLRARSRCCQTS